MAVRRRLPPPPPTQVAGFHLESVELDLSDVKCFVLGAARAGRADLSVEGSQINSDLRAPHNLERALSGYRGDAEDVLKRLTWCSNKNNQSQIYDEPVKRRLGTNYGC